MLCSPEFNLEEYLKIVFVCTSKEINQVAYSRMSLLWTDRTITWFTCGWASFQIIRYKQNLKLQNKALVIANGHVQPLICS